MKFPETKKITKVKKVIEKRAPNRRSKRQRAAVQARLVVERAYGEGWNWPEMEVLFGVPASTLQNLVEPDGVGLPTEETTGAVIAAARLRISSDILEVKAEIKRRKQAAKLDSIEKAAKKNHVELATRIMEELGGKPKRPTKETYVRRHNSKKVLQEAKLAKVVMEGTVRKDVLHGSDTPRPSKAQPAGDAQLDHLTRRAVDEAELLSADLGQPGEVAQ
jgi:hypothetical protein